MGGRPGTVPKWSSQQFGNRRAIWAGSVLAQTMWPGPFSLVTGLPRSRKAGWVHQESGGGRDKQAYAREGGCAAGCAPDAHIATGITLPHFTWSNFFAYPLEAEDPRPRTHTPPCFPTCIFRTGQPPSLPRFHDSMPVLPALNSLEYPGPFLCPSGLDAVILFLCILTAPASSLDSGYHLIHLGEALSIQ